ncbi:hypothetical protein [Flagellimonas meridianipacifica]|uniref:Uncharacterized protein n=1 Tax=Flagellimonas meridianipacifica TaxID=1080225 RepID=A0A2T0MAZ2_9FLAO|nr:hypothetical protein [Allomuricauda pacifica]PRX54635.1 hypothetical protein CLV81_3037 [Allomuricauda pacifica]
MRTLQELLSEIVLLTNHIETEYPELYRYLDENPMTIPVLDNPDINKKVMGEYMNSLKQLLENYLEIHQTGKILGNSINGEQQIKKRKL